MIAPDHTRRSHQRLAPSERKQDLIEATLDCLAEYGPHGTGVREICKRAGVSSGLLRHYYEGKDDLIVAAYRALTKEYHGVMQRILSDSSKSAEHKLEAFFEAYFASNLAGAERTGTYIAFWTLGRTEPKIQRIQRAAYRKLRKALTPTLCELAEDRGARIDAGRVATTLIAFLDGCWLDMCVDPKRFSRAKTVAICWEWLEIFLRGSRVR